MNEPSQPDVIDLCSSDEDCDEHDTQHIVGLHPKNSVHGSRPGLAKTETPVTAAPPIAWPSPTPNQASLQPVSARSELQGHWSIPPSLKLSSLSPRNDGEDAAVDHSRGSGTPMTANHRTSTDGSVQGSSRQSPAHSKRKALEEGPDVPAKSFQKKTKSSILGSDASTAACPPVKPVDNEPREEKSDERTLSAASICSMDFLQDHCWTCHIQLRHPKHRTLETNEEIDPDLLWNSLHIHPGFQVPTCCRCIQLISTEDTDEMCAGCGVSENDATLYLCDSCPRAVCETCVVQAYQSTVILQDLNDPEKSWKCCICCPPEMLAKLQDHVTCDILNAPTRRVKMSHLVGELECLEQQKVICDETLDEEEKVRAEVFQDFMAEYEAVCTREEVENMTEQEMQLWRQTWQDHEMRVMDTISILRDQLGEAGFQIHDYYHDKFTNRTSSDVDSDEDEPEWKRRADKIVEKRRKMEKREAARASVEPDNDQSVEIEELATLSDDEVTSRRPDAYRKDPCWSQQAVISKQLIEEAWQNEERLLSDRRRAHTGTIIRHFSDEQDQLSRQKSSLSSGSRDVYRVVMEKLETKKRAELAGVRRTPQQIGNHESKSKAQASPGDGTRKKDPTSTTVGSSVRAVGGGNSRSRTDSVSNTARTRPAIARVTNVDDFRTSRNAGKMSCRFDESPLLLSDPSDPKKITVAQPLVDILKPHQKEAVKFIFGNAFADLAHRSVEDKSTPGGCILSHNMGLGKSLSSIAVLHSVMYHPNAILPSTGGRIKTVLLIAPVNTTANWRNEWEQWTGRFTEAPKVYDISTQVKGCVPSREDRTMMLKRWSENGGVMIMSQVLLTFLGKEKANVEFLHEPGPDVIVIDEAHAMLKQNKSVTFQALAKVNTFRRILLTGSPFQNSLKEYFRMVTYTRPGLLGASESIFESDFISPIMNGTASNATPAQKAEADRKLVEIRAKLAPYVNRRDATELLKDLPPLQQVVLYVRPTKLQNKLYRAYKGNRDENSAPRNFFRQLHDMRPVNNHPACLLSSRGNEFGKSSEKAAKKLKSANSVPMETSTTSTLVTVKEEPTTSIVGHSIELLAQSRNGSREKVVIDLVDDEDEILDEDERSDSGPSGWWQDVANEIGSDKFKAPIGSNKVVMLFHILALASKLDEKVIVFSQCLKTLDYLENILSQRDWMKLVPTLEKEFAGDSLGGWTSGREFLRMDGQDNGTDRGEKIRYFNEDTVGNFKLFLISSRAGGVGINLCAANRVVLFDSGFNPTIEDQAVYRCYRYGQTKSVFVYRLLTQGTMEEKIYSRAVNKTTLASSLNDGKDLLRLFTAEEISNINAAPVSWVQCDQCGQWRVLPPEVLSDDLPSEWFCPMMNKHDKRMQWTCQIKEKDQAWYDEYFLHPNEPPAEGAAPFTATQSSSANLSQDQVDKLVARDSILLSLLDVTVGARRPCSIVSKHIFHDVLLDEVRHDSALNAPVSPPPAAANRATDVAHDIPVVPANETGTLFDAAQKHTSDDDDFEFGEPV